MRPANFPGRVERRKLRAQMLKNEKVEPEISASTLSVRTKKRRQGKVKP